MRVPGGLAAAFAALFTRIAWVVLIVAAPAAVRAAEVHIEVVDSQGRPLPDAVVIASPVNPGAAREAARPADGTEVIDQVDKQFVPYVKVIRAGTWVRFPNQDNIRHHVYSFSPAKRFELPLYAGAAAPPVLFDKPGVVVMGCNIHDWMVGYVYVSESPYFGKTGDDGRTLLANLPPGDYAIRIWHPDLIAAEESTARTVRLTEQDARREAWKIEVKPSLKPRRGPSETKGLGYR
jgi:plastocyanin